MKYTKKNMWGFLAILIAVAFSTTGCAENHYYDTYHHHSREWYDRHHTPPPAGVNFNVDVR